MLFYHKTYNWFLSFFFSLYLQDLSKYTKKVQHKTGSEFTESPGLDQSFPHDEQSLLSNKTT